MSDTHDVLDYTIWLSDPAQVATLQATVFYLGIAPGVTFLAPSAAAIQYSAPLVEGHLHQSAAPPFPGAPCITSSWFLYTAPAQYPRDVPSGTRDSGGFLGFFKSHHFFYWRGQFKYAPGVATQPSPDGAAAPMSQRRWVDGFETVPGTAGANTCEGGAGNGIAKISRSASRHLQGFGLHFDNVSSVHSHNPTDCGHAATPTQWERLYIRVHRFPTSAAAIWRSSGATSGNAGAEIQILPSGQLALNNIDAGGTRVTLVTTAAIAVHVWKKLDILFKYDAALGTFTLWINGVSAGGFLAASISGGLAQTQNIQSSTIGDPAGAGKGLTIDYDDWIGADPFDALETSHDWNAGSRCALIGARGLASDSDVNWVGDWRLSRQRPFGGNSTTSITSSTSAARFSITTDGLDEVDGDPLAKGIAALVVGVMGTRGAASGQLGYRFKPAAAVMAAIAQTVANDFNATAAMMMYRPAALVTPQKLIDATTGLCGLELVHDKGVGADAATIKGLFAVAEVIGTFGPEDIVPTSTAGVGNVIAPPTAIGLQNAPYPRTPWARKGVAPPTAPYLVYHGTYVGNGTFQDLTFNAPIHFLWIRASTGLAGGMQWWASMNAAHNGGGQSYEPDAPVEVLIDPAFVPGVGADTQQMQTLVRLTGAGADKNAVGVTYTYCAVSDPGLRFLNAGALPVYGEAGVADYVHALDLSTFNPDAVFLCLEQDGTTSTQRIHFKGTGSAATFCTPLTGAEIAGLSKAAGTITAKSALMSVLSTAAQISYLALRKDDGSADIGLPAVMWLATYIGDGSASRTVNFAPTSGVRPGWAMVVAHNGSTFYRDITHAGTTSTQFPSTANAATGITAGGIDSISVGSALNANGIVYDVLVFPAGAAAGNNGWGTGGVYVPVDPTPPPGGVGTPWDVAPPDPEHIVGTPTPVVVEPGGDVTDFGDQCVTASTKIVNQALSHIGISKYVGDIKTEQSEEAAAARLHYSDDLSATLRDFDWPFATRYAHLVRVAGSVASPVNGDWTYAYRAPDNMVKARRIVNPSGVGRRYDANPPKFRIGTDPTGELIYTNQTSVADGATVEPELEYTIRPTCAASSGDALFRQTLAYRHAASLALILARDKDKAAFCLQVYQSLLSKAATVGSEEQQQEPEGDADWISGRG